MIHQFKAGVLTVSDKGYAGARPDESGKEVAALLDSRGFQVVKRQIVPDERQMISRILEQWVDEGHLSLIATTGGTGLSPRDVTPQATEDVIHYAIPGIPEAMRAGSMTITPHAMLSRGLAGVRGDCLIINLPGSTRGALENLQAVLPALPHALAKIAGDASDCADAGHGTVSKERTGKCRCGI